MSTVDLPESIFANTQLADRTWTLRRRVRGAHSDLMEFQGTPGDDRVFVKRPHAGGAGARDRRLRREYRALRVLHRRLGSAMGRSLPTPMVTHLDGSALVVSALDGIPLSLLLKRNANVVTGWLRRDRLAEVGRLAGEWLRRFHEATGRPPAVHDHDRFTAGLDVVIGRLSGRIAVPGIDRMRGSIAAVSAALAGTSLPTAACHGDFLPQNVLVRSDGVGVIDFEGYRRREVVYRDLGYMLAYTMMLGRRRGYSPAALSAFAHALEKAYDERLHQDALRLFTALGALSIARDSPRPGTVRAMQGTVASLMRQQRVPQEA